jgi:hypothetical protein
VDLHHALGHDQQESESIARPSKRRLAVRLPFSLNSSLGHDLKTSQSLRPHPRSPAVPCRLLPFLYLPRRPGLRRSRLGPNCPRLGHSSSGLLLPGDPGPAWSIP